MTKKQQYFWMMPDGQTRWLWKTFAPHFRERTGLQPLLILATREDRRFYERQFNKPLKTATVIRPDVYREIRDEELPGDSEFIIRRAQQIENEHNISLMRHMIFADRHLGHSLMVGGHGHPKSRTALLSNRISALAACVRMYDFFEQLMREYPPALAVGYFGFAGLWRKPVALLFDKRNIPIRALSTARIGDLYYWAENGYEESTNLDSFIRSSSPPTEMDIADVDTHLRPSTWATAPQLVQRLHRSILWRNIGKQLVMHAARRAYGKIRGYSKTNNRYFLSEIYKTIFRVRRHWYELNRLCEPDLSKAQGSKIVYFPLQVEPEETIMGYSPEHSDQFGTLREIALSLPADATLVVKEHIWQIGRRPNWYYQAIKNLPNVLFVQQDFSSLEIIRTSSLVCTLSGSAGHEAAILGKPVLRFGRHGPLNKLSHVYNGVDIGGTNFIANLLKDDTSDAQNARRLEGARFFRALRDYCADLGILMQQGRTAEPTEEELSLLSEPLLESLPAYRGVVVANDSQSSAATDIEGEIARA